MIDGIHEHDSFAPNLTLESVRHYKARSSAERVSSNLKDNHGGLTVRVRGASGSFSWSSSGFLKGALLPFKVQFMRCILPLKRKNQPAVMAAGCNGSIQPWQQLPVLENPMRLHAITLHQSSHGLPMSPCVHQV